MSLKMSTIELRHLTAQELAVLGMPGIAFVKRVQQEDGPQVYGIFAADGTPIGAAPSLELAKAALVQHDLEMAWVH